MAVILINLKLKIDFSLCLSACQLSISKNNSINTIKMGFVYLTKKASDRIMPNKAM
ncbi:MAG: hypothetical protein BWX61_01365 [Bacteroidetes bacterium ADurb.Bin035]|nr:MAG: hypothetical protein BWX61_01365 [Bacteroidetes bacterium ADurb.Bin035]